MSKENSAWKMKSKSKTELTIPVKMAATKPPEPKAKYVKTEKSAKPKVPQQKVQEAPKEAPNQEVQLSDFKMNMTTGADNINIITSYQNQPIHTFSLSRQELIAWMHATPQQKYTFTQSKVNPTVFGNDLGLIQIIVTSYIKRINAILVRAQAQQRVAQRL